MRTRSLHPHFLLFVLILVLTSCSPQPTQEVQVTAPPRTATEEIVQATALPTPTATEIPPLPCTIAFQSDRDGNWEIYRMEPDGSNPVNLSNDPEEDIEPAFSPDGSRIAFVSNRVVDDEGGQYIYVMNADGTDIRKLPTEDGSRHPAWSPTGEHIAYDNGNDIFIIRSDGSEPSIQLTDSPEKDIMPDFSPQDDFIAWLTGEENDFWDILLMDLQSNEIQKITQDGGVSDFQWTIDAEIFFHGNGELFGCFNCVMSADGSNIRDAGGKGSIQEFLPFWTLGGDRVECVHADFNEEANEIYLVSDIYPDVFFNLTNNPANDMNPSWPDNCGPLPDHMDDNFSSSSDATEFVIGYEDADFVMTNTQRADLEQACNELPVTCVMDDFDALIEQNVDAIMSFSSRWHVLGSAPQISSAVEKGIPVVVLNAESDKEGAYNLSNDSESIRLSLKWMFNEMSGTGEFLYFVFGQNAVHQSIIDQILKDYPEITATSMPAEYGDDSVTWENIAELIRSTPNLGAIWSDENVPQLLIAANGVEQGQPPYIVCDPRDDWLEMWQVTIETNPLFKCIATINPGGTAYEGVYVAYYLLSGYEINPEALGGPFGNTLLYDYPIITNDNLDEWLGKLNEFRRGEWGTYELAPMTPEQIKEAWFKD